MSITKQDAFNSVKNNEAMLIREEHLIKDEWLQVYEYKNIQFYVNVFGDERCLYNDISFVQFLE